MSKQVPNELITTKEQSTDNQFLQIEPLIRTIRGQQVLLDSDLAILYGVETRQLNQQVKRNIERFPEDFMFQLTKVELINLKSQIATSNLLHAIHHYTNHHFLFINSRKSHINIKDICTQIDLTYTLTEDIVQIIVT